MQLSDQVCSLELSKKLKYLNVKQESLFYHNDDKQILFAPSIFHENAVTLREYCSAFTASELGEMLPNGMLCEKINNKWGIYAHYLPNYILHEKEADSRAEMLIYLIQNKLMENL